MYESFFGLTRLPFQLNPDRSFLYESKGHRDALAALQRGVASGARVMLVTGEVGAGKTTLLHALAQRADPAATVAVVLSAARLDAEMLVERLSDALGLAPAAGPDRRREALLARLESGSPRILLIIDEGQHLEASAFELLETMTDAAPDAPPRLQICLVGQPELRLLLSVPERARFRERIAIDRHLGLLDQEETRAYVEHRLRRAGWDGRPLFEDGAFLEIFVFTGGIPRRINQLCNSLLFSACLNDEKTIDASAVTREAVAMRAGSFPAAPDRAAMPSRPEQPQPVVEASESVEPEPQAVANAGDLAASPSMSGDALGDLGVRDARDVEGAPAAPALSEQTADDPGEWVMPERIDLGAGRHDDSNLAGRRRRQAMLAIAVSAAIATALIAYAMNRQGVSLVSLVGAARDVPAKPSVPSGDSPTPSPNPAPNAASPTSTVGESRPASAPLPPAAPADADAAAMQRRRATGTVSSTEMAPPSPPAAACSAQAVALGLCDANPPSNPRP